jgi:hypothetical protein
VLIACTVYTGITMKRRKSGDFHTKSTNPESGRKFANPKVIRARKVKVGFDVLLDERKGPDGVQLGKKIIYFRQFPVWIIRVRDIIFILRTPKTDAAKIL